MKKETTEESRQSDSTVTRMSVGRGQLVAGCFDETHPLPSLHIHTLIRVKQVKGGDGSDY